MRKTIPFTLASKTVKYLGLNQTNDLVQILKKNTINRKAPYAYGLGELKLSKDSYYSIWSTDSMK